MNRTAVEQKSDRELVVTRTFSVPALADAEGDEPVAALVRHRCAHRGWDCLVSRSPASDQTMAFFGAFKEVALNERIVWTNDESDQGAVTT